MCSWDKIELIFIVRRCHISTHLAARRESTDSVIEYLWPCWNIIRGVSVITEIFNGIASALFFRK